MTLTPAHVSLMQARAEAVGVSAGQRCAHVYRSGLRCFNAVDCEGDLCLKHEDRLPRELVVLRDPRTGEPVEVG